MNAVSHGLELEIVKQNWLIAKCRSQEGKEVFRWLGSTNMPHGLNKLQCIKAFKTNSKERGEFFDKSCSAPRFTKFFERYESPETLVDRSLFREDCGVYNMLVTRDPTTNFITLLKKFLLQQTPQEIERFVSVRIKPEMLNDLRTFSQRGWKQRMISLLLANWAFLKHPLIRSLTALDVSENHPFFIMFNMQQFEEPGFVGTCT